MKAKSKQIIGISLAAGALLMGGCKSSNSNSGNNGAPISAIYQGTWLAPAYGQGITLTKYGAELFEYTTNYCLLDEKLSNIDDEEIEENFRITDGKLEFFADVGTKTFHPPAILYSLSEQLPEACEQGYTPQKGDHNYEADNALDLAYFYEAFKEYSISIDLQQLDWDQLYAQALSTIDSTSDEEEILYAMNDMLQPLKDVHSSITTEEGSAEAINKPLYGQVYFEEYLALAELEFPLTEQQYLEAVAYVEEQIDIQRNLPFLYAENDEDIRSGADDLFVWFENEGLGYMRIEAMTGYSAGDDNEEMLEVLESALETALSDLSDTDGLILDVRTNGGGKDFISLAIVSHFVDEATHIYSKQSRLGNGRTELVDVVLEPSQSTTYHAPIALLTSASTVSAAETFTLSMSSLDHVRVFGEATQGALSDALDKTLPNGFVVSLSNEYYLSTEGKWYEGLGIPVDEEVEQFTAYERSEEVDLSVEAAIAWLSEQE